MRRLVTHTRATALGIVITLAAAAGAYAFWTGTGGGGGTAGIGTSASVVISATVPSGLAPGTARVVSFTAANASGSPVRVTTVHLDSLTADAAHAGCAVADFSMADVVEDHEIPAGATAEPLPTGGSLAYANTAVDQNACKGATLTLVLSSQE